MFEKFFQIHPDIRIFYHPPLSLPEHSLTEHCRRIAELNLALSL
jgi:hypothetical protein